MSRFRQQVISAGIMLGAAVCASVVAFAQERGRWSNDAERSCREEAADRLNVDARDARAEFVRELSGGSSLVRWRVERRNGRTVEGTCEVGRGGRVVRFDREGGSGGIGDGGGSSNYPRVRVDTSGRGSFDSRNTNNIRITRGWVDTNSRPTVGLSGQNNFRITFYGDVRNGTDREFTMDISGSDRGDARGRAQVRLNGDRNEVESINVDGTMNGNNFRGSFSR